MVIARVLALDPGGTTGYAKVLVEDKLVQIHYDQLELSELGLWDFILNYTPTHIVYESFQYRAGGKMRSAGILIPSQLIGVIRLYAQMFKKPLHPQGASKAVGNDAFFTDKRLKDMSLYRPGKEHGRVACKHFLWWLEFGAGFELKSEAEMELV